MWEFAALVAVGLSAHAAPPQYEAIPVPAYDDPGTYTRPVGLDSNGRVAANLYLDRRDLDHGPTRAMVWENNEWTLLPLAGDATQSHAYDISNSGIVGSLGGDWRDDLAGIVWHEDRTTLIPRQGNDEDMAHYVTGISAGGRLVGYLSNDRSREQRLFAVDGLDLEALEVGTTQPRWHQKPWPIPRINDLGSITFEREIDGRKRAMLYTEGSVIELPAPDELSTFATSINNDGVVAGYAHTDTSFLSVPVRWIDGEMEYLQMAPGHYGIGRVAINERGEIISNDSDEQDNYVPVMWSGDQRYELSDLVDLEPGYLVQTAWDIADDGSILVSILRRSTPDLPLDKYYAILSPIPATPTGGVLAVAGVAALVRRRR